MKTFFDGQYSKRSFIIEYYKDYNKLKENFIALKNDIRMFLFEYFISNDASDDVVNQLIRDMQIYWAVANKQIKINVEEFPELNLYESLHRPLAKRLLDSGFGRVFYTFNNIALQYKLYIYDLLSPCKIDLNFFYNEELIKKFDDDPYAILDYIDEENYYRQFADPKNIARFIQIPDVNCDLAGEKRKNYDNLVFSLSEGDVLDDSNYNKVKNLFKGNEKFSLDKRSIKNRLIGLWLWDRCKNPLYSKTKNETNKSYFFKILKFRFETDTGFKNKFLKANNITKFPKNIEDAISNDIDIENDLTDIKKLYRNADESIDKIHIHPLRIEKDKKSK